MMGVVASNDYDDRGGGVSDATKKEAFLGYEDAEPSVMTNVTRETIKSSVSSRKTLIY